MHIDIARVHTREHRLRLREAAETPTMPLVRSLWALLRRRREPAPPVQLPVHELERLAA